MRLRMRGHDYELPTVKYEFNKETSFFLIFFIMCDFVLFYCHRAVTLSNVIL